MKWEYFAYKFFGNQELDTLKERMNVFKELGQDNWELVSVDSGIAYFKRPIKEEIPVFKDGVKLDFPYKKVYDD